MRVMFQYLKPSRKEVAAGLNFIIFVIRGTLIVGSFMSMCSYAFRHNLLAASISMAVMLLVAWVKPIIVIEKCEGV